MEQPSSWKNRCKLSDSFDFNFSLRLIEPQVWRDLHQDQGLSAAQIAQKFGAPKSTILGILHSHGLRCETRKGCSTRAENYRAPIPPYGYKVMAGKLKTDPKELKTCQMILSLARDKGLSWSAIADELIRLEVPTRRGGTWHRHTVKIIFERWKNKI